tara:strand:+ start:10390 stop:10560 length:171 start_codon:yes stop_codon:yes gene_type:complete
MAAYKGDHYTATFDDGNNTNTTRADVYAKDDTDARNKISIAYPWAQSIVITAAANS